jgi:hypothetical protein
MYQASKRATRPDGPAQREFFSGRAGLIRIERRAGRVLILVGPPGSSYIRLFC